MLVSAIINQYLMMKIKKLLFGFGSLGRVKDIPPLRQFGKKVRILQNQEKGGLKFYIETYGCQMNVNDSEIVRSVLSEHYVQTDNQHHASIILINTCAIRQSAQERIHTRIKDFSNKKNKVIGILGCMAERLKEKMFKEGVHIVCGPDAYRSLPTLIDHVLQQNRPGFNIILSEQQTYADITPIRKDKNSISAYLTIMRGCNNMCSFCIVPFVRGRERSRKIETIVEEIEQLEREGVKEIILLGQNVNSYHDTQTEYQSQHKNSQGFGEMFKTRTHPGVRFSQLLEQVAIKFPNIRFRFTSPHPKDFPLEVLQIISKYPNICKYIHLPAQSGNTQILMKMRRNHTREAYLNLVTLIRKMIPKISFSTDLIAGFCGETEEQFNDSLTLLDIVKYDMAFLFSYSLREKTNAHRTLVDDVPEETKQRRLKEMIDRFISVQKDLNQKEIGEYHLLLLQGHSKRQKDVLMGKTDTFKNGYVKIEQIPVYKDGIVVSNRQFKLGDYVIVKVERVGSRSLYCKPLAIAQTLKDYEDYKSQLKIASTQ